MALSYNLKAGWSGKTSSDDECCFLPPALNLTQTTVAQRRNFQHHLSSCNSTKWKHSSIVIL